MKNILIICFLVVVQFSFNANSLLFDDDFDNKFKEVEVNDDKTILKENNESNVRIEVDETSIKYFFSNDVMNEILIDKGDPSTGVTVVVRPTSSTSAFNSTEENDKWLNELILKLNQLIIRKGIFTTTKLQDMFNIDKEKYENNLWNILAYRIEILFKYIK